MRERLRGWFSRLFRREYPGKKTHPREIIRGSMGQILVVPSPDPNYFKEAIFVLRDDLFFSSGSDRSAILRQARQAAEGYLSTVNTAGRPLAPRVIWFLAGAGAAILFLRLTRGG